MKRPTQLDVARIAGVSRATVSLVANGQTDGRVPISLETRERVLKAIEELSYEPDARAQALRSGDTKIISLIVPDLCNPHYWDNIVGVEQEAHKAGYNILFTSLGQKNEYADVIFTDLLRQRADGLILMGSYIDDSEVGMRALTQLRKGRLLIVEISDRFNPDHGTDSVIGDYQGATREVMAHLLSLGHRRIGLIYGVARQRLGIDRLQPYHDCLQAANIRIDSELIIHCGPAVEDGYQAALQLLRLSLRPTAIIVINDFLALGAMRAAADVALQIPADLSLVGYDDIFADTYLVPRLTTVSKDSVGMGRAAAQLLIQRIEDPNRPRQTIEYASRLILRESTGPAPAFPVKPARQLS